MLWYSNGHSEIILGKALKQLNLPRDEIVVMTKACTHLSTCIIAILIFQLIYLYFTVGRGFTPVANAGDEEGYVNQHGLSRKVRFNIHAHQLSTSYHSIYLNLSNIVWSVSNLIMLMFFNPGCIDTSVSFVLGLVLLTPE